MKKQLSELKYHNNLQKAKMLKKCTNKLFLESVTNKQIMWKFPGIYLFTDVPCMYYEYWYRYVHCMHEDVS